MWKTKPPCLILYHTIKAADNQIYIFVPTFFILKFCTNFFLLKRTKSLGSARKKGRVRSPEPDIFSLPNQIITCRKEAMKKWLFLLKETCQLISLPCQWNSILWECFLLWQTGLHPAIVLNWKKGSLAYFYIKVTPLN